MRLQLALNVDDLDAAIDYYGRLFGVAVNKREPGYANFVVVSPPLKLVLFEAPGSERLNHLGVEVFSQQEVDAAAEHLTSEGLLDRLEEGEVCCYARQNKAVSYDPQGLMWEWYQRLEDSSTFFEETPGEAACSGAESAATSREPAAATGSAAQEPLAHATSDCCGTATACCRAS